MSQRIPSIHVAVFAPDARLLARVRELLGDIADLHTAATLAALHIESADTHCVLIASSVLTEEEIAWVRAHSASSKSYIPLVLLTGARPQTVEDLARLPADEGVLIKHMDTELRPAIRRQVLRVLTSDMVTESSLPAILIEALRTTCYDQPPPRFLKALANRLDTDTKALWHEYVVAMKGKSVLHLSDLHEAIVVIRFLGWKSKQRSWRGVAEMNQSSLRWLRTAVRRRTGYALRSLDDAAIESLQFNWLIALLEDRLGIP